MIFVAANGEQAAVTMEQYAVIDADKGSATPEARKLAAHLAEAGKPPRPVTVVSGEGFQKLCLAKRHCVVLFANSTVALDAPKKLKALGAKLGARARTANIVVADLATMRGFSLEKALPSTEYKALYLRALSRSEKRAVARPTSL